MARLTTLLKFASACKPGMQALARMGASMTGIEPQQENISAAIAHAQEDPAVAQRTKYLAVTAEELVSTGELSVTPVKVSSLLLSFCIKNTVLAHPKLLLCDKYGAIGNTIAKFCLLTIALYEPGSQHASAANTCSISCKLAQYAPAYFAWPLHRLRGCKAHATFSPGLHAFDMLHHMSLKCHVSPMSAVALFYQVLHKAEYLVQIYSGLIAKQLSLMWCSACITAPRRR